VQALLSAGGMMKDLQNTKYLRHHSGMKGDPLRDIVTLTSARCVEVGIRESAFSNAFKLTTGMAPKRYGNVFANMDRSTTRQDQGSVRISVVA
jgi:hypothetical protein